MAFFIGAAESNVDRLATLGKFTVPYGGFVRIRWDHETFFGNTMVYGTIEAEVGNSAFIDYRR